MHSLLNSPIQGLEIREKIYSCTFLLLLMLTVLFFLWVRVAAPAITLCLQHREHLWTFEWGSFLLASRIQRDRPSQWHGWERLLPDEGLEAHSAAVHGSVVEEDAHCQEKPEGLLCPGESIQHEQSPSAGTAQYCSLSWWWAENLKGMQITKISLHYTCGQKEACASERSCMINQVVTVFLHRRM